MSIGAKARIALACENEHRPSGDKGLRRNAETITTASNRLFEKHQKLEMAARRSSNRKQKLSEKLFLTRCCRHRSSEDVRFGR
jgi:hypothetical protein